MKPFEADSQAERPRATAFRVAFAGAEHEENLALRYLASAVAAAGASPSVHHFDGAGDPHAVARRILAEEPELVGLSLPFQGRAQGTLGLVAALRAQGFAGTLVVGGHFATFEHEELLRRPGIDAVVRHEGEATLVELIARLRAGRTLAGLAGTVVRAENGLVTGPKRLLGTLDELAPPLRPATARTALGVPFAPMLSSRGCYADCAFCCISAYADSAEGARYRVRSVEGLVREMKAERERRGVRLFVFHDDNFLVPSHAKNVARVGELEEQLRAAGMADVGLIVKCRPNDVQPELFERLRRMGTVRCYVGIETNSDEGQLALNRRTSEATNTRALETALATGVLTPFNILLFEPETTLDGVLRNLDFMERFAAIPFNFCRAEVYAGTELQRSLQAQGRLRGDAFGWNYRIRDDRAELLFRITTTAFANRNFRPDGAWNQLNLLRSNSELLRWFYPRGFDQAWQRELVAFTTEIGLDSVRRLRAFHAFVRGADVRDDAGAKAFTLEQARALARADLAFIARAQTLLRELEARAVRGGAPVARPADDPTPPWAAETARIGSTPAPPAGRPSTAVPSAQVRP